MTLLWALHLTAQILEIAPSVCPDLASCRVARVRHTELSCLLPGRSKLIFPILPKRTRKGEFVDFLRASFSYRYSG